MAFFGDPQQLDVIRIENCGAVRLAQMNRYHFKRAKGLVHGDEHPQRFGEGLRVACNAPLIGAKFAWVQHPRRFNRNSKAERTASPP